LDYSPYINKLLSLNYYKIYFHSHNASFIFLSLSSIIVSLSILSSFTVDKVWASTTAAEDISTYMITTRDFQDYPEGVNDSGFNNNYQFNNISQLFESCPAEVVFFVHGYDNNNENAKEQLDRVKISLEHNNYTDISLIGYSWPSDTGFTPEGWIKAKQLSIDEGKKLAEFILNYIDTCQQEFNKKSEVRLIGHSLGGRLILSTLNTLNNNQTWNDNGYQISSVHLLGAAVDNEEISKNQLDITNDWTNWNTVKTIAYGNAIEKQVINFYNLYSSEDNIFQPNFIFPFFPYQIYPSAEGDWALGQSGYQTIPYDIVLSLPKNYNQINVQNELPPLCDSDGNGKIDETFYPNSAIRIGDNHGGYLGFRNSIANTTLLDDGAMDIVVYNWKNIVPLPINQPIELTSICN
jgi:pimeloyl-ACP methyl ester carboxylesterase